MKTQKQSIPSTAAAETALIANLVRLGLVAVGAEVEQYRVPTDGAKHLRHDCVEIRHERHLIGTDDASRE